MNFRKGEVDNYGFYMCGEFYWLLVLMNFFIKGIGIYVDKCCCDEWLSWWIVVRKKIFLEDDGEIFFKFEIILWKILVYN